MIISKKRYEAEIQKRVEETACKVQESMWRSESERNQRQLLDKLEYRIIALEKKNGIDHPSHHHGENAVVPSCW